MACKVVVEAARKAAPVACKVVVEAEAEAAPVAGKLAAEAGKTAVGASGSQKVDRSLGQCTLGWLWPLALQPL